MQVQFACHCLSSDYNFECFISAKWMKIFCAIFVFYATTSVEAEFNRGWVTQVVRNASMKWFSLREYSSIEFQVLIWYGRKDMSKNLKLLCEGDLHILHSFTKHLKTYTSIFFIESVLLWSSHALISQTHMHVTRFQCMSNPIEHFSVRQTKDPGDGNYFFNLRIFKVTWSDLSADFIASPNHKIKGGFPKEFCNFQT